MIQNEAKSEAPDLVAESARAGIFESYDEFRVEKAYDSLDGGVLATARAMLEDGEHDAFMFAQNRIPPDAEKPLLDRTLEDGADDGTLNIRIETAHRSEQSQRKSDAQIITLIATLSNLDGIETLTLRAIGAWEEEFTAKFQLENELSCNQGLLCTTASCGYGFEASEPYLPLPHPSFNGYQVNVQSKMNEGIAKSRRKLLATVAGIGTIGIAGCSGDGSSDSDDGGSDDDAGGDDSGDGTGSLTGSIRESTSPPDTEILSHSASRTTDQYDEKVIQVTVEFKNTGSLEKRVSGFGINVDFYESGASEPIDMFGGTSIVSDAKVAPGETHETSSNFSFNTVEPSEIARYELYWV